MRRRRRLVATATAHGRDAWSSPQCSPAPDPSEDVLLAARASQTSPRVRPHPPTVDSQGGIHNPTFYYAGKDALRPRRRPVGVGKAVDRGDHPEPRTRRTRSGRSTDWAPRPTATCSSTGHRTRGPTKGSTSAGIRSGRSADTGTSRCSAGPPRSPTAAKRDWYFLDTNERGLRSRIAKILASYKAMGWDGLMWDRGGAATQNAVGRRRPVGLGREVLVHRPSLSTARCTFADAYVDMLGLARQAGLQVMLNTGTSALRPGAAVQAGPDRCLPAGARRLGGRAPPPTTGWTRPDLLLNESVAFPKDKLWQRTFEANQRSEREGRRVVGLLTTYTLGGPAHQNRADVFYEWARVKLFDLPLAVNTGNDDCDGVPERRVQPLRHLSRAGRRTVRQAAGRLPACTALHAGQRREVLWTRQYAAGREHRQRQWPPPHVRAVDIPDGKCRYVYDVFTRKALAGNRCISRLRSTCRRGAGGHCSSRRGRGADDRGDAQPPMCRGRSQRSLGWRSLWSAVFVEGLPGHRVPFFTGDLAFHLGTAHTMQTGGLNGSAPYAGCPPTTAGRSSWSSRSSRDGSRPDHALMVVSWAEPCCGWPRPPSLRGRCGRPALIAQLAFAALLCWAAGAGLGMTEQWVNAPNIAGQVFWPLFPRDVALMLLLVAVAAAVSCRWLLTGVLVALSISFQAQVGIFALASCGLAVLVVSARSLSGQAGRRCRGASAGRLLLVVASARCLGSRYGLALSGSETRVDLAPSPLSLVEGAWTLCCRWWRWAPGMHRRTVEAVAGRSVSGCGGRRR